MLCRSTTVGPASRSALTEAPYRFGSEMRTMFFLANTRASQSASFNCAPLARSPGLVVSQQVAHALAVDEQGAVDQFLVRQQGVDAVVGHGCWLTSVGFQGLLDGVALKRRL